ncbi:MAG TPA: 3'(2'),5'-bisphosphate nucleotidase CysQ [Nitrospira sp.]|jgi:myo-inositol-1(or 4)-monophosphatase|nr:3'(2'),5'-bisphosphate nucleotidase CysQ [Nitrospira sp.]
MERELAHLTSTIRKAGDRARELAKVGFDVQTKKDRSPVTTADLEVNRILREMKDTHFPDDGWLSEESPDDAARLDKARVWIVDPIDGTKAYVNKLPEYCISVGLIEAGMPVLGAIFNPSTDELFTAVLGDGLRLNGRPLAPAPLLGERSEIMVSPWEYRRGRWADLDGRVQCRPMLSIAHGLALVAAGRVQATLTIEPENEWDLAAGVLLVQESGGTIADAEGRPFTFNQATPRFRGVLAVAATAGQELRPFLQTHADRARLKKKRS